jgi:transcription elongation factor GreA
MSTATPTRSDALSTRLQTLRAERDQALRELLVTNSGDTADRATNVDANARLSLIEQRIASIEAELHRPSQAPRAGGNHTSVTEGDVVTIDLGDGPETFLFAGLERAGGDLDIISPASPLGRAIDGAAPGTTVTYRTHTRRELTATVVAIS